MQLNANVSNNLETIMQKRGKVMFQELERIDMQVKINQEKIRKKI